MGKEHRIARSMAGVNHGAIDRATARAAGLTDSAIHRKLLRGDWEPAAAGVYYANATQPDWRALVRQATLAAGPASLASHRTAARLFGLEGFDAKTIEITVPYENRPIPSGVIVHRTRRQLPSDEVGGIPVTAVERTILDVASLAPESVIEKLVSSALRKGLTTRDRLGTVFTEQGGRGVRGAKKARRALLRVDEDRTGSPAEVDLARLIRKAPIPRPISQFQIDLPDGSHAYPDFSWPVCRKIVEVDGHEAHSSPHQLHSDLARQNALLDLGWEVRRFSARAVRREPQAVIDAIVRFIDNVL